MFIQDLKSIARHIIPRRAIEILWHLPNAVLANLFYGFPGHRLETIAVAGTKGKSTTCHLIARALEQAGKRVALLSTITIKIADDEKLNYVKMTTPSAWFVQKFLRQAAKDKCDYAIIEVTSHALAQFRVWGIPFHTAVITNLMPDHLDYHKTAEDYQKTHLKLLTHSLKNLIINSQDPYSQCLEVRPLNIKMDTFGQTNSLAKQLRQIHFPLLGEFNFENALAAAAVAQSLGTDFEIIKKALENPGVVPGRMENIDEGQPFKVMVDYAHSPDSLKALFQAVKPLLSPPYEGGTGGATIVVFGACGDRDSSARAPMGKILDEACDIIIVTNDDPYSENPEKIAAELMGGIQRPISSCHPERSPAKRDEVEGSLQATFPPKADPPLAERDSSSPPEAAPQNDKLLFKILNRRSAIAKALSLAAPGDLVLILGKGAEQWQVFKDKKAPWDDREVIREELKSQNLNLKSQK